MKKIQNLEQKGLFGWFWQIFGNNYIEIVSEKNNNLPNWLRYEVSEGQIIFKGNPNKLNKGEFVVQIFNKGFIAYQFSIIVQSRNKSQENRLKSIEENNNLFTEKLETNNF